MKNKKILAAAMVVAHIAVPPVFGIEEHSIEVGLELNHTDNVFEQVDNKQEDTELSLLLGVDFEHSSQNSLLNLNYSSSVSEYLEDSYDRRTSVNGIGRLDVFSSDKVFGWFASTDEQDTVIDVVGTNTPDNFSQRSVYRTGPVINLRINTRNTVKLEGVRSKTVIANSDADSETSTVTLIWSRAVGARTQLNLSVMKSTVKPEMFAIDEYDQEDLSIGFVRRLKHGRFAASAGEARIEKLVDFEGDTLKSDVYDLSFLVSLSQWTLLVTSAKQLQSSGENGFFSETDFDIGSQEFGVEINQRNKAQLNIFVGPGGSNLVFDYSNVQTESPLTGAEREMVVQSLGYAYYLTPDDNLNLRYTLVNSNEVIPELLERDLDRDTITLSYTKGIGRSLNAICGVSRQTRQFADSSDEAVSNSGYCSLSYVF